MCLYTIGFNVSVLPLSAQVYVCARQECTDQSVTNATQVSSTSAALAAEPVSVTTTQTTVILSLVSCWGNSLLTTVSVDIFQNVFHNVGYMINDFKKNNTGAFFLIKSCTESKIAMKS